MKGRVTLNFILALVGILCCTLFFVWLLAMSKPAQAAMQPQYLLAFVLFKTPEGPKIYHDAVAHKSLEDCLVAANKLNNTDPDMKHPSAALYEVSWVCLEVHRVTV